MKSTRIGVAIGMAAAAIAATSVRAQEMLEGLPVVGVPVPRGVNYQPASTSIANSMHWLSHYVHAIMILIVAFVMVLIAFAAVRYNARRNPTPARFTHNTRIEIAWTLVPVLILILIGSFSLPLLFTQIEVPEADVTIKATGYQWYWNHEYPDYEFSFDSFILPPERLEEFGYSEDLYLLATDTAVVVPQGATVRLQTTGGDVIHSWTIPAFGVKMDAVPGRLNETWFNAHEIGVYFGQCSELCGKDHAYMPITVKVVSPEVYEEWLDWAIGEYGGTRPDAELAQAQ
jgi:cytochrome c oxidase subunit II